MEKFQKDYFQTTFHHHFQPKNGVFGYRFHFEGKKDDCFIALKRVKTGLGNNTTSEHLIQHKSNKLTLGLGFYLGFSYIDGRVNAYCLQYYSVTLSLVVKIVTEVRYLPPVPLPLKYLNFSFHIHTKVIWMSHKLIQNSTPSVARQHQCDI